RGNAPTGLLWRMEGMDIPNPNHFAVPGLSGGGISILNSQLLANSDFVTAAFAAEYGNALSGVFDIRLRKGNNEKREYNLQAGVMGLSASAEGPFSKNYKGSYLVNYRYSTLSILGKLGVLSDFGATNFQDLSYNIQLPAGRAGNFSLFGFAGKSDQGFLPEKDSLKWESAFDRYKENFLSNTSMNGATHTLRLGTKWNIRSGIGLAHTKIAYSRSYMEDDLSLQKKYTDEFATRKWTLQSVLNYQAGKKLNMRAGFIAGWVHYRFYQQQAKNEVEPLREVLNTSGNTGTQQLFAQAQYKPANEVILSAGVHYLRLAHNNTTSVEPRFSARWNMGRRSSISAGYGLHSQVQTLNLYFSELPDKTMPNRDIGFTRAHHYVLSHSYRLTPALLLKTELYYQRLFRVPVNRGDSGSLSGVNIEYDYITDPLVNKGKGKNYGLEISLERYLRNHFYCTLSNSLYQSKYTAADGIERNTRYNGNYTGTLIAGKDFVSKRKHRTIGVNIKTIYAGGMRTTPIDVEASQRNDYTVFIDRDAFSVQNPAYFRTDLRLSIKWNRKYVTSTLSLDIQNVTNRLNVFNQSYDKEKNKVVTNYQTGLIPILNYKIDF
ncbi:MAG: TonB-dependent receptor, partial [Dinghuibacter sp.]|nr:TonB-dependent receptor [Dinghuibacter sp.]